MEAGAFDEKPLHSLKPDLITNAAGRLRVVDVCVCGNAYVDHHYKEKQAKYGRPSQPATNAEASSANTTLGLNAEVFPLVVDERGTFHRSTMAWMQNSSNAISAEVPTIFKIGFIQSIMTTLYRTFAYAKHTKKHEASIEPFDARSE